VDSIKMDLRKMGWDGVDWIDLAQDRDQWRALVNTVMNLPTWEVLEWLHNWQLFKKGSATWVSDIYIVPCWWYLLGLQTTPLNCSHSFIADSMSRYYNHSITVGSDPLMSCVRVVCWCLPFSKASCSSTDCFFHTDSSTGYLRLSYVCRNPS
jgi:hypothetical protein